MADLDLDAILAEADTLAARVLGRIHGLTWMIGLSLPDEAKAALTDLLHAYDAVDEDVAGLRRRATALKERGLPQLPSLDVSPEVTAQILKALQEAQETAGGVLHTASLAKAVEFVNVGAEINKK
jgi:hypothetical protein